MLTCWLCCCSWLPSLEIGLHWLLAQFCAEFSCAPAASWICMYPWLETSVVWLLGFPCDSNGKEFACNAGERAGFDPLVGKISWRREWQSTPVFLPGESHGQSNQEAYNCKESDTAEQLIHTHTHTHTHTEFCCSGRHTLGEITSVLLTSCK